jgi:hypothetical protein
VEFSQAGRHPRAGQNGFVGPAAQVTTFIAYSGVNCLRASIATLLQADRIEQIPNPEDYFEPGVERGFDINAFNDELEEKTGYGIRTISPSQCPPRGYWIAIMRTSVSEHESHAIACREGTLLHDSAGIFRAYQPSMLEMGLRLVEA